jgi:hypothetical protein
VAHDRIELRLTGEEAQRGLPLANVAAFLDNVRRALRDFDRARQGQRTQRGGHPTSREELVTALRLVDFRPGSAIMSLEPMAHEQGETGLVPDAEALPVENLLALIAAVESRDDVLPPAVTESIDNARRTLGPSGAIEIKVNPRLRTRRQARIVIDAQTVETLQLRAEQQSRTHLRIVGRLHMLDDEPRKIGIRAGDGVDWICSYPEELEEQVLNLVRTRVVARGLGVKVTSNRGRLDIESIEPVEAYEQSKLFTLERVEIGELMARQGIEAGQGIPSLLGDDVAVEDLDAFLDALREA